MPPIWSRNLNQKITLWAITGRDRYGDTTLADPIQVRARIEKTNTEALASDGAPIALDAIVTVNLEVDIGSKVWLGKLVDWYGTGSAGYDSEVMEVVTVTEIPTVKARGKLRELGLKKFKDTPE